MVGKCFYHDTFPKGDHLFVVLAPSLEQEGWFICVNITTKRKGSDTTCELPQGCHQEMRNPVSVVLYAQARELPPALIERLTREQKIPDMPPETLSHIQTCAVSEDSRMRPLLKKGIVKQLQGASSNLQGH